MNTRVNSAQQEILLDWLEKNPELASGVYKASHGRLGLERQWTAVAQKLNKHGAPRDADKWQRVWRDWKSNTKKKVNKAKGDKSSLTEYEQRVLALIGSEQNCVYTDGDTNHGFVDIEVKDESLTLGMTNNHSDDYNSTEESETERDWQVPSPAPLTASATPGTDPLRGKNKHRRKQSGERRTCDGIHCGALDTERRRLRLERRQLSMERARLNTLDKLTEVLTRLAQLADRLEARYFKKENSSVD